MVELYAILVTLALAVMTLVAVVNIATFRNVRPHEEPKVAPFVSVLLPARNEEHNIGMCLSTLTEQDYPRYEVIVLDDNSEDATYAIASKWQERSDKLTVLRGQTLPQGWVGKSWACHQLAQHARGKLLLFVDADTLHTRHSIRASVAALEDSRADLLTLIPRQVTKSFWERLIIPLLYYSSMCFLPFILVPILRNERFAMANGQFMLFRREVYDAIGGHKNIRTAMVEDVWLSRLVKKHGFRLAIMDGKDVLACRMYRSLPEIWEGFSKNLFPGFKYSIPALFAVVVFNVATSVVPFIIVADNGAFFPATLVPVSWLHIGMVLFIRTVLALRFRLDTMSVLLHPVAMLTLVAIALNSSRLVLFGDGSRWKGRSYNFRKTGVTTMMTEG